MHLAVAILPESPEAESQVFQAVQAVVQVQREAERGQALAGPVA